MPDSKGTILVVDDEPEVLRVTGEILRTSGYRVIEALSGPEALDQLSQQNTEPDLLLTDLIMPGMTGRMLADSLTNRYPGLTVVFMSGYVGDSRLLGTDPQLNYLEKPYDRARLVEYIRRILKKRHRKS